MQQTWNVIRNREEFLIRENDRERESMWRRHQQSSCVTTSLQLRTLKPTNWWMRRDDDDNRWPLEVALYASKNHWQLLHTRLCITRVVRDLNKAAGAAWSTMFTPRRSSITARSTRPWSGSRIRVHSCPSGMRPGVPAASHRHRMRQGSTNLLRFRHARTRREVVPVTCRRRRRNGASKTTTTTTKVTMTSTTTAVAVLK